MYPLVTVPWYFTAHPAKVEIKGIGFVRFIEEEYKYCVFVYIQIYQVYYFLLQELSLSGWQLIRKAGEGTTTFKFHRSVKIEPGHTVTVWSGDQTGQAHEPPENLVMKGQKWVIADHMTTVLLNSSGEVSENSY